MGLRVSPSIIAADQARLGEEVMAITRAGADYVHLDVMDGHFVPNLTMGPGLVKALRRHTNLPFDCHLMLAKPVDYIDAFIKAGADRIAIHVEAADPAKALDMIASAGINAGISVNPDTNLNMIAPFLDIVDFVIVMTVHPGFYGQKMIPTALDKVAVLRQTLRALDRDVAIQVDGGVTVENAHLVARAGADEVVAGSAVFQSADYRTAIDALKVAATPG